MDWESRYLVMVDPSRNVDKHWQITRNGKRVLRQWGRRGGGPQHGIKEYGTVYQASEAMVSAIEQKRAKGYQDASGSIPLPPEFQKEGVPVDTRSGYFLAWKALAPVSGDDLREAAAVVIRVVKEFESSLGPRFDVVVQEQAVEWPQGTKDAVQIRFMESGCEEAIWFGFPSPDFLTSIGPVQEDSLLKHDVSRDGWLTPSGKGQGTIDTHRRWVDFPVRLFLAVLSMNGKVEVSDADDQMYGNRGFRFNLADHRDFVWSEHWETGLKPAIQAHWVIEGEGLLIGKPSLEKSPFAW